MWDLIVLVPDLNVSFYLGIRFIFQVFRTVCEQSSSFSR